MRNRSAAGAPGRRGDAEDTAGRDPRRRPAAVVRAFAPAGPGRHAVVAWARRQARRTGARLELLVEPPPDEPDAPRGGPVGLLARLVRPVLAPVVGASSLADRLARAAAGSGMLVVPQRLAGVDELVDAAYEPVAVIPDEPTHTHGPVVLALAPRTADEAVATAFAAAAHRGSPLLAVRLRAPSPWTLEAPVGGDPFDDTPDDEGEYWRDRLAAWRVIHPEVPVEVQVAEGDPALALVDLSARARLLVLGRSARGRVLASVAASPVGAVTLRARCPVLVVPPPGPPRRSWWPRSS
ncbi:universal stress protein [Actinomycetospora lemnae]|uniref:Universal stress protein n=1 Tax=Actinomycetospora lemnae TaxID=3019891 RepID=A0ABT5SYG9_9PSEU|nr:universal stress protein [Actinomycetospora sp. DW7H6]MDD7967905.1 universal stress protein [Actinomycetospora sp. DW7H6]